MRRRLLSLVVFSGSMLLAGSIGAQTPPNILLIIADDISPEMIGTYRANPPSPTDHPYTPTINQLAADGVRFTNTWSNAWCAATRATIQTGRYGYRTSILGPTAVPGLSFTEETIPELLPNDYASALIGKWGLTTNQHPDLGERARLDAIHAVQSGYDTYMGSPGPTISPADYFAWDRWVAEFVPERSGCNQPNSHLDDACIDESKNRPTDLPQTGTVDESYATTVNVDDAIAWIGQHSGAPWFLVLAFNAPHKPDHRPPGTLHYIDPACTSALCDENAMVEAMDTEIGRLRAAFDPPGPTRGEWDDTVVIFVGDNGNDREDGKGKGTLFQGGINVPLIVMGKGVQSSGIPGQPRVSEALVNTSDLFTTVLKLARVDTTAISLDDHDSYSIVPILTGAAPEIRELAYAENVNDRAIRDRAGIKLTRTKVNNTFTWHLYNLASDPQENQPSVPPLWVRPLLGGESTDPPALLPANTDEDADGVPNTTDNCRELPQDAQCDTDEDGYGNLCDGDFDNDGDTDDTDAEIWLEDFTETGEDGGTGTDLDCDGGVFPADFDQFHRMFLAEAAPGPSGLSCAGVTPCSAP